MIELTIDDSVQGLAVGLVEAIKVRIGPSSPALREELATRLQRVRQTDQAGGESRRKSVRELLRRGGFKPSGRNKPAQEYLLRSATEAGQLPEISNAVDLLNLVSLESGLPISLVALERIGTQLVVRYGRADERYVFNASGQELDVEGLICLCKRSSDDSEPVGSPVKDSLLAKVVESDQHLLACLYAPQDAVRPDELYQYSETLARLLEQWCGAECQVSCLPESW